uniref:Bloodthirsty-related gene family, member 1 n=1 Tax=Monopterus albus TaxID=43700 RepID=A0A3Q3K081_MONAL
MALPAAFLSEDQFTCSICLEVFNNPVSTPCGHSFCQACISSYWNGDGGAAKSYQCPLCKETFRKRPELHINRTLKEITEQFKQMSSADVRHDGGAGKNSNSHSEPKSLFLKTRGYLRPDRTDHLSNFQLLLLKYITLSLNLTADITLDPYTSHPRLIISVDGKQVHCGERHQQVPDNPERFDRVVCVLARQGFSIGQHYWEVEVGEKTDWDLGIASHSVNRKGKINVSPAHGYWFLSLRDGTDYTFRTEPSTKLTVNLRPSRIGIFVDCDKGLVSFYNVEARALIYTFTASFPQTIRPFFSPCTNKSGRNGAPLIICPVPVTE